MSTVFRAHNKGFTLLEVLLSVSLIALITGIGAPIYQSFQTRNDLDIAASSVVQTLRRAQILSQASDGDTSWGMKMQSGSVVLFKGVNYAARDTAYDEVTDVPTNLTPSGISEVVFAKFTGLPLQTGTLTLTSNSNESRTITINTKGVVGF